MAFSVLTTEPNYTCADGGVTGDGWAAGSDDYDQEDSFIEDEEEVAPLAGIAVYIPRYEHACQPSVIVSLMCSKVGVCLCGPRHVPAGGPGSWALPSRF